MIKYLYKSQEDKINDILDEYNKIEDDLNKKDIIANFNVYSKLSKRLNDISVVVNLYREYKDKIKNLEEYNILLNDEKDECFRCDLKKYILDIEKDILDIEDKISKELVPRDFNDDKNVILEIRAGVGGDEAGIFAGDLLDMYHRYAENNGWKVDVISYIRSTSGGYKEFICNIIGDGVYSFLKYESGVHRVQRIPKTETKGRIHTSAVSVVVLPEIEEVEVNIDKNDIRKDTFCSTGAGGQSVNTTYSAVRLTHIPSGIVVTCQDERSQIKNYERALKVLYSRLYEKMSLEKKNDIKNQKREIVKSGDRSDKIRTYNFPQNRITDHRINFTVYNLDRVLNGFLDEIINALKGSNIK